MGHLLTTDETTEIIMHQANELNIMTEATMTNTIDNRVWIWMRNVENQNTPVHNKTKSEKGTSLCVKKERKRDCILLQYCKNIRIFKSVTM